MVKTRVGGKKGTALIAGASMKRAASAVGTLNALDAASIAANGGAEWLETFIRNYDSNFQ
jgi:hypothetical protein